MPSDSDLKKVVGLDIGTSKVVAIVGEIDPEGELEIIGGADKSQARGGVERLVGARDDDGCATVQPVIPSGLAGVEDHGDAASTRGSRDAPRVEELSRDVACVRHHDEIAHAGR